MAVTVIDSLGRGGSGISPFAITREADVQNSYMTVADLTARDAIPTWQRLPFMRVYVISTALDYRLDGNINLNNWSTISTGIGVYQLLSEKGVAGGYVPLEATGKINPSYIDNIYANNSYVVVDNTARNALTTLTGDIIVTTSTSKIWVKLNNNPPVNVPGDFAELLFPGNVLSVNGMTGAVSITIANLLLYGSGTADFNAQVAIAPAVTSLNAIVAGHTSDIATNASAIISVQNYTETHIGQADLSVLAANPTGAEVGYSLVWNGTTYDLILVGGGGGGVDEFVELLDVPHSYTGYALNGLRVNAGETGLEFYAASPWLLDSGGVLTNANTITINTANWLTFNGTWTATANNQYHVDFAGSLTGRAGQAGDTVSGYKFTPTLTTGTNGQTLNGVIINPTFSGTGTFASLRVQAAGVNLFEFSSSTATDHTSFSSLRFDNGKKAYFYNSGGGRGGIGMNSIQLYIDNEVGGDIIFRTAGNGYIDSLTVGGTYITHSISTLINQQGSDATSTVTQIGSYPVHHKASFWTGAAETKGWFSWRVDASAATNSYGFLKLYGSTGATPSYGTQLLRIDNAGNFGITGGFFAMATPTGFGDASGFSLQVSGADIYYNNYLNGYQYWRGIGVNLMALNTSGSLFVYETVLGGYAGAIVSSLGRITSGGYGAVGSNYYFDVGSSQPKRIASDWASAIEFSTGGFLFRSGSNGAAGAAISFSTMMSLSNAGALTVGSAFIASPSTINGNINAGSVLIMGVNSGLPVYPSGGGIVPADIWNGSAGGGNQIRFLTNGGNAVAGKCYDGGMSASGFFFVDTVNSYLETGRPTTTSTGTQQASGWLGLRTRLWTGAAAVDANHYFTSVASVAVNQKHDLTLTSYNGSVTAQLGMWGLSTANRPSFRPGGGSVGIAEESGVGLRIGGMTGGGGFVTKFVDNNDGVVGATFDVSGGTYSFTGNVTSASADQTFSLQPFRILGTFLGAGASSAFYVGGAQGIAAKTTGGNVALYGGSAYPIGNTHGGQVNIAAGSPNGSGSPGFVTIDGASALGGNVAGGDVTITAGNGFGSGAGGAITLKGGAGGATGPIGAINLYGVQQLGGTANNVVHFNAANANHTGLTASSEVVDIYFNLARTVQRATGAVATNRAIRIGNPTYSFVGASVITDAYTVYVDGAPVAGTNATITNRWGLGINGNVKFFNTLYVPDITNIAGGSVTITAPSGGGGITLANGTTTVILGTTAYSYSTVDDRTTINGAQFTSVKLTTSASTTYQIWAAAGISGATTGQDLYLYAGGGYPVGTTAGGSTYILSGTTNGGGTEGGVNIQYRSTGKLGFFAATPQLQQSVNTILVNNVTSGGTVSIIADFTSLTVYATDAATIRNNFYRLTEKVLKLETALRNYGLVIN